MTLHRITLSLPGIFSAVATALLALTGKYTGAVTIGIIGAIIQSVLAFFLSGAIVRLLDESRFLYIPLIARQVNGEPSTAGLDQPDQVFLGTEYQSMVVSTEFARSRYPGRKDIRAARLKVSLDEIMLKPDPEQK